MSYQPLNDVPVVRRSKNPRLTPTAYAYMIKALQEKPCTLKMLAEATGLGEWSLRYHCKALVLAQAAHIAKWDADRLGRDTTPYYKLGFGINVPRASKTAVKKSKDYRDRLRKRALEVNEQQL